MELALISGPTLLNSPVKTRPGFRFSKATPGAGQATGGRGGATACRRAAWQRRHGDHGMVSVFQDVHNDRGLVYVCITTWDSGIRSSPARKYRTGHMRAYSPSLPLRGSSRICLGSQWTPDVCLNSGMSLGYSLWSSASLETHPEKPQHQLHGD